MATINGNFTDADGNLVNIADLIRGIESDTKNYEHMSPISGWVYDSDGNRVNLIDIIRQADSTDVKGVKVNSGEPVVPDEEGYVNLTLTADLTPSEKQQLINLLN